MRILAAAAIAAILVFSAGSAFAQDHVPMYGESDKEKTPTQIQADKAAQRAYEKSLKDIPDQGATDPWGVVRSTDAPKASAAKPAKKTKAGAVNN